VTITGIERRNGHGPASTRSVALVVRVSTDRQASNPEGSLKTQLQRLRAHIDYKNQAGESWSEAGVYELKAVSGKDSMRSQEYAELFAAIRAGRVDTILCTALERLCRSVSDFLWFFEFINQHGVEFVCLKQQYDTTTPQGKLFVTIMIALAEFEREQTAERTRDATLARAERGLWNGGRLLGYDLDPGRKGYLLPSDDEAALVNFAFDTYLSCGSIKATRDALNSRGFRTKAYESRRGKSHPGSEFTFASVQYLLKNPAYIGKKEINKSPKSRGRAYQLVDAVWPAIVETHKFEAVQRLLATNGRTRHNATRPVRHVYVLSGLLDCGLCEGKMEGRSGTGRLGVKYFYYACRNQACGARVAAHEVEDAIVRRLGMLAADKDLLGRLTCETNTRLQKQRPVLAKRRLALQRSLATVKAEAEKVLREWSALDGHEARTFLTERLSDLARQRGELELGLEETEQGLGQLDRQAVSDGEVRAALSAFEDVFECLMPYERKELLQLVIQRAEVRPRKITMNINGSVPVLGTLVTDGSRSRTPSWLPGEDSNLEPSG
jgi:site-specific DNA recombinase